MTSKQNDPILQAYNRHISRIKDWDSEIGSWFKIRDARLPCDHAKQGQFQMRDIPQSHTINNLIWQMKSKKWASNPVCLDRKNDNIAHRDAQNFAAPVNYGKPMPTAMPNSNTTPRENGDAGDDDVVFLEHRLEGCGPLSAISSVPNGQENLHPGATSFANAVGLEYCGAVNTTSDLPLRPYPSFHAPLTSTPYRAEEHRNVVKAHTEESGRSKSANLPCPDIEDSFMHGITYDDLDFNLDYSHQPGSGPHRVQHQPTSHPPTCRSRSLADIQKDIKQCYGILFNDIDIDLERETKFRLEQLEKEKLELESHIDKANHGLPSSHISVSLLPGYLIAETNPTLAPAALERHPSISPIDTSLLPGYLCAQANPPHIPVSVHVPVASLPESGDQPSLSQVNRTTWAGRFPWTNQLHQTNQQVFGNSTFRPLQEQIINASLSRKDCFVLMPTGSGKSLTYQLPALLDRGLTIIISPLLSLIQDQVSSLRSIPHLTQHVESLSGDIDWSTTRLVFDRCRNGQIKMLYVTPEKIHASNNMQSMLAQLDQSEMLSRFVIDESHCVSSWGFDFRESYSQLWSLRNKFPTVPIIALTATATPLVANHVIDTLQIQGCERFKQSFNRTNLYYEVRRKGLRASTITDMVSFIKQKFNRQCGIVYCLSKHDCSSVSDALRGHGIKSDFYHAAREIDERQRVHSMWTTNKIQVICATVAFGMGINKRDVRFVIHFSMSKSPEAFYQESGRAGRDGLPSHCLLYYSVNDRRRAISLLSSPNDDQTARNPEQLQKDLRLLDRMTLYCENTCQCRRSMLLEYFGEKFQPDDCKGSCDNCVGHGDHRRIQRDIVKDLKLLVDIVFFLEADGSKLAKNANSVELIAKGSKSKAITVNDVHTRCHLYGKGQHLQPEIISRMIAHLFVEEMLIESVEQLGSGGYRSSLRVNPDQLWKLDEKYVVDFWNKPIKLATKRIIKPAANLASKHTKTARR